MCNRSVARSWTVRALATAALAAGLPTPAVARQTPAQSAVQSAVQSPEAELVRRIEELAPKARAATARALRTKAVQDSVRRANAVKVETVELRVGSIPVVTRPGQEETARRLISEEIERMAHLLDSDAVQLGERAIVFQFAPVLERIDHPGPVQVVELRSYWGESAARRRLRQVLGARATEVLPELVAAWMGAGALLPNPGAEGVHRGLILDGSRSGRACARGHMESCWASFGLSGHEDPLQEWFESDRRHGGVAAVHYLDECRRSAPDSEAECLDRFLRTPRWWSGVVPFEPYMRADLVSFALAMGGPGALDRFVAGWPEGAHQAGTHTSRRVVPAGMTLPELGPEIRRHLSAAAGIPEDELMRRWHDRVIEARPEADDFGGTRLAGTFWFLFFAALAMRSTRWRLG